MMSVVCATLAFAGKMDGISKRGTHPFNMFRARTPFRGRSHSALVTRFVTRCTSRLLFYQYHECIENSVRVIKRRYTSFVRLPGR